MKSLTIAEILSIDPLFGDKVGNAEIQANLQTEEAETLRVEAATLESAAAQKRIDAMDCMTRALKTRAIVKKFKSVK